MRTGPGLYSRAVAVLKVGLPLIAVAMLASLFVVTPEDRSGGELVFSDADLAALGTGLRITRPTFSGMTRTEDRFRFTADLVVPDAAPPKVASITALVGRVDFADGRVLDLTAETADLEIAEQRLEMRGTVRIVTSDGYSMAADQIRIDLRAGRLEATEGVKGDGPMGRIEAGTLTIVPAPASGEPDAGAGSRVFSFGDGVRLVYAAPASGK